MCNVLASFLGLNAIFLKVQFLMYSEGFCIFPFLYIPLLFISFLEFSFSFEVLKTISLLSTYLHVSKVSVCWILKWQLGDGCNTWILSLFSNSPICAHLGCSEQADVVYIKMFSFKGGVLRQLQCYWEAAAICGARSGAHHYHLEMAGR